MRRTIFSVFIASLLATAWWTPSRTQSPRPPNTRDPAATGPLLYEKGLCNVCHGDDRRGNENAPTLDNLGRNWDEESLAGYLKDPAKARATNPRIRELAERYGSLEMPPWSAPEAERRALAAWLLAPE